MRANVLLTVAIITPKNSSMQQ